MSATSSKSADGPEGPGPHGKFEHRSEDSEPLRCVSCGDLADTVVYATFSNGSVRVSIGSCATHAPASDDAALELLDTALRAIAGVVNEADEEARKCRTEARRD
ncbi:MAG: hypothetical protein IT436_12120 [Phycisphaerales bacterium]|nr:hypothetical protein [Phycisphaerales bacterium]